MTTEHILKNGNKYRVVDTGKPYQDGEYPSGGFVINRYSPKAKEWQFVSYSPDMENAKDFLKLVARSCCLNPVALTELDIIQGLQNNGRGVKCVQYILLDLRRGQYETAKAAVCNEWDKIRNYPEIVQFFKDYELIM